MIKDISHLHIEDYINKHTSVVNKLKEEFNLLKNVSYEIASCLKSKGTIFWCGNGGSMADASHLAAELMGRYEKDRPPLRSIALGHDSAVLTCIANDYNYENIFSRELFGLASKNDYLIVLSTSGNSENIIKVLNTANNIGMKSFAMLGKNGGLVKEMSSSIYVVPDNKTSIIQEVHITMGHLICEFVENYLNTYNF